MPDSNTKPDTQTDDEDDAEQDLKQRVKAYVLAAYAYVAGALSQSAEEIAPQLRGLSLPGVSLRTAKALVLGGILITAAVAMPAAPSMSDAEIPGEDPVEGETFEPESNAPTLNGATLNSLPDSFTDASMDAPDPPEQVRASAGSQTMNVETAVVDGEPAIVLEDDQTHDGRWVSIETGWLQEHVGEIPSAAYIDHETDGEYAAPLNVRGDSAAFYVREFSTNTVTFDGEVTLSGSQAGDGSQFEYELGNTSGVDDPSINLTGVENTETSSVTVGQLADGDSKTVEVGGSASPKNETVTLSGVKDRHQQSITGGTSASTGDNFDISGNLPPENESVNVDLISDNDEYSSFTKQRSKTVSSPEVITKTRVTLSLDTNYNKAYSVTVDGNVIKENVESAEDPNTKTITIDHSEISTDGDAKIEYDGSDGLVHDVKFYAADPEAQITVNGDANTYTTGGDYSTQLSTGSNSIDASVESGSVEYNLSWDEVSETENPVVEIGPSNVSHSGILSDGETITKQVELSAGEQSINVSTSGGTKVKVEPSWTEVTQTLDPVVELNGETVSHSGTLADGETVSLDANASALQEGTNRVNISTNSPSSGPASLVGFEYAHSAETTVGATVSETTWSQQTNVSRTWPSDRANATATLPMNDRVVDVRDVEVRYNGTSWQPVSESDYTLNGTDLTVQLGDVASGSTTEVRATGSKVRVSDGAITVLDPTTSSDSLNTRVQIDDAGPDFSLAVDETVFGDRVHYADNATWGATGGTTTITADGGQTLTLPNATVGAEATVRTWPVEVAPTTGQVAVSELAGDRNEPGIAIRGDGNSEVDYTYVDANDATPYVLYSVTNEIVRDEGLASSPITLTDDNSDETLQFIVDDGSASGTSSGSDSSVGGGGGGGGPMAPGGGSVLAQLQGIVPSGQTLLLGVTLLGGLFVVGRRSGVITDERQEAATSAAAGAAGTAGSLVERALDNQIVVGGLILGIGAIVLGTGLLPGDARLIVGLGTAPVGVYLALQQFGEFDFRVWAGSTIVIGLLGMYVLAPEFFQTIAEEAGIIIVLAGAYLGYKAISAYRTDAETPDEQTNVTFEVDDDGGGN